MDHSSRLWTFLVLVVGMIALPSLPLRSQEIINAQTDAIQWSNLLDQAEKYENNDKYQESENVYRTILSQPRPESMNDYMYYYIQIRFGQILQTQGKFNEAIAVLQKVIDANSGISDIEYKARDTLKRVLAQQQNSAQNVTTGLQEIQNNPTSQRGYYDLAKGLATQGKLANGFIFLESQLGHPLTLESALELTRAAMSNGVEGDTNGSGYRSSNSIRQEALALFRQLVQRYPYNQTVRTEFQNILELWGDPQEAIAFNQESIQLSPQDYGLYWKLAKKLENNNQINDAIAIYEKLLAQKISEPRLYINLGDLMIKIKQPDRAIQSYLQGIQKFPKHSPSDRRCHVVEPTSYDRLVQILASHKRLDQVLSILETSLPNASEQVYTNLATALVYEKHSDQAEIVDRRLKERYPHSKIRQRRVCGGD